MDIQILEKTWGLDNPYFMGEFAAMCATHPGFLIRELQVVAAEKDYVPIYFTDYHEAVYFLLLPLHEKSPAQLPSVINFDAHDDFDSNDISISALNEASWASDGYHWVLSDYFWIYPEWGIPPKITSPKFTAISADNIPMIHGSVVITIDFDYFSCVLPEHTANHEEIDQAINNIIKTMGKVRKQILMIVVVHSPNWVQTSDSEYIRAKLESSLVDFLKQSEAALVIFPRKSGHLEGVVVV